MTLTREERNERKRLRESKERILRQTYLQRLEDRVSFLTARIQMDYIDLKRAAKKLKDLRKRVEISNAS